MDDSINFLISLSSGQISFKKTGFPFGSIAIGSFLKSMSILPAIAYATTSIGEPMKAPFTYGLILPSKFLFPLNTAAV